MRRRTLMCLPNRGCCSEAETHIGSIGEDGDDGDCGAIGECGGIITFRRRIFLTPGLSSARDECRRIAAAASTAVIVKGRRNMICRKKGRALHQIVGSANRNL